VSDREATEPVDVAVVGGGLAGRAITQCEAGFAWNLGPHAVPGGFVSLLTTGLFGVAAKLEPD